MRAILNHAKRTSRAVPQKRLDIEIGGSSRPLLEGLRLRELLRVTGTAEWMPTLHGLLLEQDDFRDIIDFIEDVVVQGHAALRRVDDNNIVEVDTLAAEIDRSSALPLSDPSFRFFFGCALFGLDPYIDVDSFDSTGQPLRVRFAPELLSFKSLSDVLAAREANAKATRALAPEPRPREALASEPTLSQVLGVLIESYEHSDSLRAILIRDAQEVELCRTAGAHKAVLLLCGSILEGALVQLLTQNQALAEAGYPRSGRGRFPDDASLGELLGMALKPLGDGLAPLLDQKHASLVATVIDHRDLIHPHRETRGQEHDVDRITADIMYSVLCRILADMGRAIANGWLEKYAKA